MNPVQRPLENVLKHPPIIMDLAVIAQDHDTESDSVGWPGALD